jgi:hypothetical protein
MQKHRIKTKSKLSVMPKRNEQFRNTFLTFSEKSLSHSNINVSGLRHSRNQIVINNIGTEPVQIVTKKKYPRLENN